MKRFYFFALVAAMFAACTSNMTDEQAVCIDIATPETLIGTFEGDEMRIQLDNGKTVWTADDLVSVFYLSNANQKWQYQGETGERTGNLKQVEAGKATETMKRVVVVYPYNDNYYINTDTYNVKGWLPAEQTYLADSYGLNGNIMISQSEYNQFSLKNVCGWLKLQLTGNGEKVQSITLKGNNGEQVAGEVYINSADATASLAADMGSADDNDNSAGGNLVFEDTILTEVALNCPNGVTLGSESTAFYIALPPQEFSKGLTVEVACSDGSTMTKSTENTITIERNTILPMAVFEYIKPQPNNEIWYTSSDGNVVTPYNSNVFGAQIVSNTYENGKGIITFNDDVTSIGNYAFRGCTSLTSVIIGNSVISIGDWAFHDCASLVSATIGNSVTSIGSYAFSDCSNLMDITIPDSVTTIEFNAFYDCTSLTSVTIGNGVTSIDDGEFYGCSSLKAFYGKFASEDNRCLIVNGVLYRFAPAGLTEYTIPDSVTSIGERPFQSCSDLCSIVIPNSVASIGDLAFTDCTSLTSVTIGDSVISIGEYTFEDCTSLKEVYCKPITPPSGGTDMFYKNASGRKIYVPRASVDAYKAASYWSKYKSYIEPYDF